MNKNLDRIEAQLRDIFEKKFLQIFTLSERPVSIIESLVEAMRDNLEETQTGQPLAPNLFMIEIPPEDLAEWQTHQDLLDQMAHHLYDFGIQEGFHFNKPPVINLKPEEKIPSKEYAINAYILAIPAPLPDTSAMEQPKVPFPRKQLPKDAFFVVGGKVHFPLDKPVINIGRHSDNDLVLEDQHVSRHHAQLRAINRRFIIFDVGSTGGILLNHQKVSQASLQAGDVVRIGVTNLIYIQEATAPSQTTVISIDENDENSNNDTVGEKSP